MAINAHETRDLTVSSRGLYQADELWLFRKRSAPAFGRDQFVSKGSTWHVFTSGCARWHERAIGTDLLWLVLRILGGVHFGGVWIVSESHRRWVIQFEFDGWWCGFSE